MTEYTHCPDAEELAAWIDGEVDEATRRRLVAHLDTCARCAEVVEGVLAFQDEEALEEDGVGADLVDEPGPSVAEFAPPDLVEAPSRRWRPYFAVALAACAVVWSVRVVLLAPKTPPDFAKLDAWETTRGANDLEIAKLCYEYFSPKNNKYTKADRTLLCLEVASGNSDLAQFVVRKAPGFAQWLEDPVLREDACNTLGTAFPHLPDSLQDRWRSALDGCPRQP
jgi:Putative zinc-finger